MPSPASRFADAVTRRPTVALTMLVLLTVGIGSFATRFEQSMSFDAFAPSDGRSATLSTVTSAFGTGGDALQVMFDAGEGGDVLTVEGLAAAERAEEAAGEQLGERASSPEQPMVSYAAPVRAALERVGAGQEPDDRAVAAAASGLLGTPAGAQVAGLLSQDLDVESGSARAGLGIVELAEDLDDDAAADAALELRDALEGAELGGIEVHVVGEPLLNQASSELTRSELPRLLGLSLLLITLVLALVYRRVIDVVIGLAGLGLALVWTYGIGSLLGPGWLGWTGPFNQITTVVPVLVAGLGIDFALHLTTRQREERAHRRPAEASSVAMRAVGGALVLTTVTTAIGFLTNVVSPLPPIGDFGVFTAVGVVSSFVVMTVLVPAARTLVGRRAERRGKGTRGSSAGPLPLVRRVAAWSTGHATWVLAGTLMVTAAALAASFFVPTTFDTDDFLPSESRVAGALSELEELFGADVSERTYVLLEGPLERTDVGRAIEAVPRRLAEVDGVRTGEGTALVDTPLTVVAEVAAANPQLATELAELGWTPDGLADDADLSAIYQRLEEAAPDRAARVLEPDGDRQLLVVSTTAGQDGADALVADLRDELSGLREAGVEISFTGQELVFAETVDVLTGSQLRSIGITLGAAAVLLVGFFGWRRSSPLLGAAAMVPTVLVAVWVVGTMWLIGLSFNVLTITVGSLAIAVGVDYGIHITYRFVEERRKAPTSAAIHHTLEQTGGALAGSAMTTGLGFGVLVLSSITPIEQFGIITALVILYSMVASVLVMPALLKVAVRDDRAGRNTVRAGGSGEVKRSEGLASRS